MPLGTGELSELKKGGPGLSPNSDNVQVTTALGNKNSVDVGLVKRGADCSYV